MKKYIKQQRDYTVVGITAVIDAMVGDVERKAYGGGFDEVFSVVKDGVYYHYEVEGGREEASRYIIRAFNEGGMLCHAAIVARELKKPCVIGTKHATHFLKDGDMVEVDATRGIVRKL